MVVSADALSLESTTIAALASLITPAFTTGGTDAEGGSAFKTTKGLGNTPAVSNMHITSPNKER